MWLFVFNDTDNIVEQLLAIYRLPIVITLIDGNDESSFFCNKVM